MSKLHTQASTARFASRQVIAWALVCLSGLLTLGALVLLVTGLTASQSVQSSTATPGLHLLKDITLPSIVTAPVGHAPIRALPVDGFDFQALDPHTRLLFISHPGPNAAKWQLEQKQLPSGTQFHGQLVVFDINRRSVVTSLSLPDIHGVVVAPDLERVYAADVKDDRIYVIDERSLHIVATIPLGLQPCVSPPCEIPDGLAYDPVDHRLFVSDNGTDPAHQDLGVIDVLSNRFVAAVPLGLDRWGDALGHPQYDAVSHRLYLAVQPQAQPTTTSPAKVALPASHFLTFDPVSLRVLNRVTLSNTRSCSDAHGLVLDTGQRVAFMACVATHTMMLIDLRSMHLFGPWTVVLKPDILRLDESVHRLYIPGTAGVSILDESSAAQGRLTALGTFVVSKSTSHTLEVDPRTHNLYFPVQDNQGNPVLRVLQFAS
jgi:YVTN family beta-propeller protein